MIAALILLFAAFSWPTPVSTPSSFVGVTTQATPTPPLTQAELCFQDNAGPTVCGQNLIVSAGDVVCTGMSMGQPQSNGTPSGGFPATITLIVNNAKYSNVPVGTNGLIGCDLIPGLQIISVSILGTTSYLGAVQTVQSQ